MRWVLVSLALVAFVHSAPSLAQDTQMLGRSLPGSQGTAMPVPPGLHVGIPTWDSLATHASRQALAGLDSSQQITSRGAAEEKLYKQASNGVVIVNTKDGLGSGILIASDGHILTNWHVVGSYSKVIVIFKSPTDDAFLPDSRVVRADVVYVDKTADLALLKAAFVPRSAQVLQLGDPADVQVGADVSAIGHPTGETWTYTKGIISQVWPSYQWQAEGAAHTADVIQTQTPINPGNSGGPLLTEASKVIGVNAFLASGAEGLNYAVSITQIHRFLAEAANPSKAPENGDSGCRPKVVFKGRSDQNDGNLTTLDVDCSGKAKLAFFAPDDASRPYEAWIDRNGIGRIDMVVYAEGRSFDKWKCSLIDSQDTGKPDVRGIHADGGLWPTSYVPYDGGPCS